MKLRVFAYLLSVFLVTLASCEGEQEHTASAIGEHDSLPFMNAHGISTLISDSGVIRYKIVAEEWHIYDTTSPASWDFRKGFFMERYDEDMGIDLYVQADTAYLHMQRTWELRGRVVVRNIEGTLFQTEELFWDMDEHKMWNHMPMHITMPDRELYGTDFRSNEQMTDYFVTNSVGALPAKDVESETPAEEEETEEQ